MRRLMLVLCLLLVGARAEAAPFTPNTFHLIINGPQPYQYCFHCDDADFTNDYHLSLTMTGGFGGFFQFNDILAGTVSVTTSGLFPAESTIIPFAFSATMELWNTADLVDPHSFTNGVISGNLWLTQFDRLVDCCRGIINTMPFYSVHGFMDLPTNGTNSMVLLTTRPNNPEFMPAEVPEPSTLLLLGTGLIALRRGGRQRNRTSHR